MRSADRIYILAIVITVLGVAQMIAAKALDDSAWFVSCRVMTIIGILLLAATTFFTPDPPTK